MSTQVTPGADPGAGTNNPSAGAGQGNPPAATPPAGASAADWTSSLSDEMKGYVQNKGFKDPTMILDSYRNFEKLMGAPKEKLLRLPDNIDDPQAANEFYSKLGRPGAAADYKIAPKEGGNKEFAGWMETTFFDAGLSTKQAEKIVNKWNEFQGNTAKAAEAAESAKLTEQEIALKKEWGAAYEQKISTAKKAASKFGVEDQVIDALEKQMGFDKVMKFFDAIGSKIGEAEYVGSGSANSFQMTPAAARSRIEDLKTDTEFKTKLLNGDTAAKTEWERLHVMAAHE